jgi:hypothetical protein
MNQIKILNGPYACYARALVGTRLTAFRDARQRKDHGASAIELAIITAILVGLAVAVLVIITQVVDKRSTQIKSNNGGI